MSSPPTRKRGRPKSPFTESSAGTMQSLDRALAVLKALSLQERATLTDLSLSLGIPTATTHRILGTLQKHGFSEFGEDDQRWMVGIEAYRIGVSFLKRTNLLDISRPIMRHLMETAGETANLAVPDKSEVVFVGQVETQHPIRAFFHPGTRTPMHSSGTGKAILATMDIKRATDLLRKNGLERYTENTLTTPGALFEDLDVTRARGWSYDREERYAGMSCIGAAIFDARAEAVGGVSISGPSIRFADQRLEELGLQVTRAAREITEGIGGVQAALT